MVAGHLFSTFLVKIFLKIKKKTLNFQKGGLGLIWFVLWIIFASNSPDNNRFIGENEKEYVLAETIETRASHEEGETGAPWGSIFTSKACLALFLIHSCSNWGTYLFLTSLPSYMKEVLKFDIKSVIKFKQVFY